MSFLETPEPWEICFTGVNGGKPVFVIGEVNPPDKTQPVVGYVNRRADADKIIKLVNNYGVLLVRLEELAKDLKGEANPEISDIASSIEDILEEMRNESGSLRVNLQPGDILPIAKLEEPK